MIHALLLAFQWQLQSPFIKAPISGQTYWTEPIEAEKLRKPYHPKLRFYPQSAFMFITPDFIMQGTYNVRGSHYMFKAVMAFELENSDVAHLKEDMDSQSALKFAQAYARSMQNFEGDYNSNSGALVVTYPVKGVATPLSLHPYTEGDDQRDSTLHDGDRGIAGLWQGFDDHSERLDSRTRYKIGGLERLERFVREAMNSDGAQFSVIDFHVDHTYRMGADTGNWKLEGRTVMLRGGESPMEFTLNDKGQLTSGGKPAFIKG